MTDCKDIKYCSESLLKKYKIIKKSTNEKEKEIVNIISLFIDKLIFNISALISLICLKIGIEKLHNKDVSNMADLLNKRLTVNSKTKKGYTGGAFNTAAFYGVSEPVYKIDNLTKDVMQMNFEGGIARPALGATQTFIGGGDCNSCSSNGGAITKFTGCNKVSMIVKRKISKIFKYFKVTLEKEALLGLITLFNKILEDLFIKLENIKGEVTEEKVKAIVLKYKFMHN